MPAANRPDRNRRPPLRHFPPDWTPPGVGKDNQDTRLLRALRPYLHGEREKRLDEAIRLLQMAPLLQMIGGKEGT